MEISYLPIDVPPIPDKEEILANFRPQFNYSFWQQERLVDRDAKDPYDKPCGWSSEAKRKYPSLLQFIDRFLPFEQIVNAKFANLIMDGRPHTDFVRPAIAPAFYQHCVANEPCGYRLLINGVRKRSFFVCREEQSPPEEWNYVTIPESTDTFLIPYTKPAHGTKKVEDNRLVVFLSGIISPERHQALIKRSVEKYSEYMVSR